MRCDEVQAYLAEHLTGLLADRLSGKVQSHIRDHVMSCADCCEELEDFEEMQKVLRSIPVETCDSEAMRAKFDSLMVVRDAKLPPSRLRQGRLGLRAVIVVGGVIVMVATVFIAGRHHNPPVPVVAVASPVASAPASGTVSEQAPNVTATPAAPGVLNGR
ncbi:MAG TPA: hypothetical protein VK210_00340, partial [Terriglobia bacterium]|nr:hypothetical protein [Terriglobia bacterium]